MSLFIFVTDSIDNILDFILRIAQFYSHPKFFLIQFSNLKNKVIFSKIFLLNIVYYGLIFIFSSFFIKIPSNFTNFWVSLIFFELFFLFPVFLVQYLLLLIYSVKNSFKKTLIVINLTKILIFFISIIFSILFLQNGDYGYIYLRAISLSLFVIFIILGPLNYIIQNLLRKISFTLINLLLFLILVFNLNFMILKHSKANYSFLYDPVATEFFQIEKDFSRVSQFDFAKFDNYIEKKEAVIQNNQSDFRFPIKEIHEFNEYYSQFYLSIKNGINDFHDKYKSCYQSNRYLIELIKIYLEDTQELVIEYFKLFNIYSTESNILEMKLEFHLRQITLNDKIIKKSNTEIKINQILSKNIKNYYNLFEWNLIVFDVKKAFNKENE
jgi:hypothetical protein